MDGQTLEQQVDSEMSSVVQQMVDDDNGCKQGFDLFKLYLFITSGQVSKSYFPCINVTVNEPCFHMVKI